MTFADRLRDALATAKATAGAGWNAEKWAECVNATAHAEGITKKRKPKGAARARNPLFDALAVACGFDLAKISRKAGKMIGVALADIIEVDEYLTPMKISAAIEAHRKRWPGINPVPPNSLAKWWGSLMSTERTRSAKFDPYQEPKAWRPYAGDLFPGVDPAKLVWNELGTDWRLKILKAIDERPPTG